MVSLVRPLHIQLNSWYLQVKPCGKCPRLWREKLLLQKFCSSSWESFPNSGRTALLRPREVSPMKVLQLCSERYPGSQKSRNTTQSHCTINHTQEFYWETKPRKWIGNRDSIEFLGWGRAFRVEISRMRIDGISSLELGSSESWYVFLFRDWWLVGFCLKLREWWLFSLSFLHTRPMG